ncbi:site-specific integrase [uncultured Mucilaginibacter sp.]|uniref:site-specific integrase n=1 Tax=uncultured Mucilaginibacter sp. TaxID=797541 RepID=UPI0025E21E40|nr:site-specific integrase [uncultured Mucilaginibacter sp.]
MASVKIIFRNDKKNHENKSPLYIRIIKNRKAQFLSLGIYLNEDEWDDKKLKVKSRHPNSARLNSFIAQKVAEAEDMSLMLAGKDINVTSAKIKNKIKGRALGSFTAYGNAYRDSLLKSGHIGTYIKVKASLSKLDQFAGGRELQFEEIDTDFLKRYEKYLTDTLNNAVNTVHGSFRTIRKLFNDATRESLIEPEHNPFFRYKLKLEKTTKIYLTDTEIAKIEKLQLPPGSKMEHHRLLFVFACYAAGIRVSDLLQLQWRDFNGTHLSIVTQKTTEHITIPLPSKAIGIIEKYKSEALVSNDYIFPFLKSGHQYTPLQLNRAISSCTAYLNRDLKDIAGKAEIDKHISMHTSRHSWATRALRKGMRIEYVSALMGHSSIKTTQVYAKIVNAELDKAMEVFND